MALEPTEDFRDLIRILRRRGIRFMVVGAHAMASHGYPRTTGDIDIWIDPEPQNATSAFDSLREFGAPLAGIEESDFANEDLVFQIGVPPGRIDILTAVSGLDFASAYSAAVKVTVDGLEFHIPRLDDLITNKLSSGRPKDLLDVEALELIRRRKHED